MCLNNIFINKKIAFHVHAIVNFSTISLMTFKLLKLLTV